MNSANRHDVQDYNSGKDNYEIKLNVSNDQYNNSRYSLSVPFVRRDNMLFRTYNNLSQANQPQIQYLFDKDINPYVYN